MAGFQQLLLSCDRLEESLNLCVTGAVSCNAAPSLMSQCTSLMNDIKLINAKKMLLLANMNKESFIDEEEMEDEEAAFNDLSRNIDVRLRWSNALKAQALSKAAIDIHREQNEEQLMCLKNKMQEMSTMHQVQDQLSEEVLTATQELLAARLRYQETAAEYAKMREETLAANKSKTRKDDNMDIRMGTLLKKIEVIRWIQRKLMVSCTKYDWCSDPAKLLDKLPNLRKAPPTFDTFLN